MHKAHSLTIHNDGVADAVHLPDIISHSKVNRPVVDRNVPSFGRYANHLSVTEQTIAYQMDVFSVEAALNLIGVGGLCIDGDINPGSRLNLAKYEPCGDMVDGAEHRGLLASHGVLVPTRLVADHRGDARLTLELFPIASGGNPLVATTDTLPLPSITIESARWTLGPITIGGIEIESYTQVDINFGNMVEPRGIESNPFNTMIEVRRVEPEITIRGIDLEWFSSGIIPLGGRLCTHADTRIMLRKRDPDGVGFVSDVTAEHLQFTMNGVALIEQLSGSTEDRFSESGITIYGREDTGNNNPLMYAGSTAISSTTTTTTTTTGG